MLSRGVRQTKLKYRVAPQRAGCSPRQMIERWTAIICPIQAIPSSIIWVTSYWGGCYGYLRATSTYTETKSDVEDTNRWPGCKLTLLWYSSYLTCISIQFYVLQRAFLQLMWISEQTAIISLYSINWLVFKTEKDCVYCAVRTESLYIIQTSGHYMYHQFKIHNSTFCPHTVFVCFV
jgi:hypothetical protein